MLGYANSNDVSSRHWQRALGQWSKGKSFETFCPIGPCLNMPEVVGDPDKLFVKSRCVYN